MELNKEIDIAIEELEIAYEEIRRVGINTYDKNKKNFWSKELSVIKRAVKCLKILKKKC